MRIDEYLRDQLMPVEAAPGNGENCNESAASHEPW
jgi:hypothetical protein